MAGRVRRAVEWLGLHEFDEDYDDEEGYDDPEGYDAEREPVRQGRGERGDRLVAAVPSRGERYEGRPDVRHDRGRGAPPAPPVDHRPAERLPDPYRITTVQPRTYNEARTIGEHFREGVPVIINLTEMDDGDAKRLVDFAAGLIFGLHGSIERVTNKVFLLSPSNVEVSAEDKARIVEGGFFNQS